MPIGIHRLLLFAFFLYVSIQKRIEILLEENRNCDRRESKNMSPGLQTNIDQKVQSPFVFITKNGGESMLDVLMRTCLTYERVLVSTHPLFDCFQILFQILLFSISILFRKNTWIHQAWIHHL